MCYIDSEMENKGYRYARYVDDISFSFNFEEEINFTGILTNYV